MPKTNFSPLKGFRDFLPPAASHREWLRARLVKNFRLWGYQPLETPTLESADLFAGEVGEDEKLFYRFKDLGDREVMLRYDQTVPTCRVLGLNHHTLNFPFRRYQIQPNFRAEKPQSGRYREFTQADIDIFGVASPQADAEIIALGLDTCRQLGFTNPVALINSRDLMQGLPYTAIVAIDKLSKIGPEGVIADMQAKGIPADQAQKYLHLVQHLKPNHQLEEVFAYLKHLGFPSSWYRFEPTLARSFSYSQGPIWEIVIPQYSSGSVGGGERYDSLIERLTGQTIPGTGFAFGIDRLLEAVQVCGLLPETTPACQVLVAVFSPELLPPALQLAAQLRNLGISTQIYPDPLVKLDKQLKYASRQNISFVAVIGPQELSQQSDSIKNLNTGLRTTLPQAALSADTFLV